jgi:hypothetical protein
MTEDRLTAELVEAARKAGETASTVTGWLTGLIPDLPPWVAAAVAEELRWDPGLRIYTDIDGSPAPYDLPCGDLLCAYVTGLAAGSYRCSGEPSEGGYCRRHQGPERYRSASARAVAAGGKGPRTHTRITLPPRASELPPRVSELPSPVETVEPVAVQVARNAAELRAAGAAESAGWMESLLGTMAVEEGA